MTNNNLLNDYSKKITSQFGEDGILLEIFNRIGKERLDNWCVEFGARDGISDSNTYNLIKNYSYNAVLIEGDKNYYNKLCKNFIDDSTCDNIINEICTHRAGISKITNLNGRRPVSKNAWV